LDGLSDLEVRELCIAALRQWHARWPDRDQFSMHGDLGGDLLPLLAQRKAAHPLGAEAVNTLREVFIDSAALNASWMRGVVEFMVWLVRAGLAWPLGALVNQFPITLRLTGTGARLLALAEDHPLLPQFVQRIGGRCPGLPDDVLSLLSDAGACLDNGLMRPAVVLMGVAYEVAVEHLVDALVGRGVLQAGAQNGRAAARITSIRNELETLFPGRAPVDARSAAAQALDFADQLRRRRNDASHTQPTYGFEDRAEVEELLVSAGRHLPNLWRATT
jgi:hypothetical protein